MKKIVFTVTNDLTYDQRMNRICRALANGGYDVLLVGRKKKFSSLLTSEVYRQTRLYCYFQKGKLFYLEYNIRLFWFLLFQKADIIGAVDLDTIVPCSLASRIKGCKLTYDAHEYFTEVIEVVNRPGIKKIWEWVEKVFVPSADVAYTVNESLKLLFEEKYGKKFGVIRNVPAYENFTPPVKEKKYIVYAGVVNEGRGLEELIDAMKYVDCELYICGNGDIYDKLTRQVKEAKMEHKITFYGYVAPVQLKEIIRGAFIGFLLLKNSGKSYYYSLANKFFDYMHAGIPQITINFPEYRVINEKYKIAQLVELETSQIISAINQLINDPVEYKLLSANALEASKQYNWQKESENLLELYKVL